jgi:hypothetical protein
MRNPRLQVSAVRKFEGRAAKSGDGNWARRLVFYLRHGDGAVVRNLLRFWSTEVAKSEEMAQ